MLRAGARGAETSRRCLCLPRRAGGEGDSAAKGRGGRAGPPGEMQAGACPTRAGAVTKGSSGVVLSRDLAGTHQPAGQAPPKHPGPPPGFVQVSPAPSSHAQSKEAKPPQQEAAGGGPTSPHPCIPTSIYPIPLQCSGDPIWRRAPPAHVATPGACSLLPCTPRSVAVQDQLLRWAPCTAPGLSPPARVPAPHFPARSPRCVTGPNTLVRVWLQRGGDAGRCPGGLHGAFQVLCGGVRAAGR